MIIFWEWIFILLGLIFAVAGILLLVAGICSNSNKSLNICLIIGFLILGCLFAGVIAFSVAPSESYEENLDSTINLYALGSGNGVHGKFIVGAGTIDDVQYYSGYTNIADKQYKQVKFDASKSILILDDNETPRVEVYQIKICKNIFGIFAVDNGVLNSYEIYVPTDGIDNEYKVN